MLREDAFDIVMPLLETVVPSPVGVPARLKAKTTKTP
jgi:hypothetical protein